MYVYLLTYTIQISSQSSPLNLLSLLKRRVPHIACLAIRSLDISIISCSCSFWTVVFNSWNVLVGSTLYKRAYGSVVSNRIRMKFDRIVLQVNVHWLTEPHFWYDITLKRWRPWRHCCIACREVLQSGKCACSIYPTLAGNSVYSSWCIVHSYLLTYLYVF